VHGREVAVVEGPWGTAGPDGTRQVPAVDAIVTAHRGVPLAVLTADCTPLLLADPVAGVAAAVHAGRPGLVAGVVPAAVTAMTVLGADPAAIIARTGPAICGRCYEVPATMRAEVAEHVPGAWSETSWNTPAVDVTAGVMAQLEAFGVTDRQQSSVCTLESHDHFSYRRDRVTGRLAGYVWLD
jgi:YfiH family protein